MPPASPDVMWMLCRIADRDLLRPKAVGVVLASHGGWTSMRRTGTSEPCRTRPAGSPTRSPLRGFADDIMAVIADAAFVGPPVLVGHSMGGLVSIVAGSLYGDRLAGAV